MEVTCLLWGLAYIAAYIAAGMLCFFLGSLYKVKVCKKPFYPVEEEGMLVILWPPVLVVLSLLALFAGGGALIGLMGKLPVFRDGPKDPEGDE